MIEYDIKYQWAVLQVNCLTPTVPVVPPRFFTPQEPRPPDPHSGSGVFPDAELQAAPLRLLVHCDNRAIVEMTCPKCRHVVDVPPGKTLKCHNCRTRIAAPLDNGATDGLPPLTAPITADTTPPVTPLRPGEQPLTTPPEGPATSVDESAHGTAAIATLVFGLLFFIPLVTQVIALVVGCLAIVTRKPSQRMKLAWIGMALAIFAMIGWLAFFTYARTTIRTGFTVTALPYAQQGLPPDWEKTSRTSDTMERVQRAALAYHRDFGMWPDSIASMAGHRLPQDFALPEQLQYRPVPSAWIDHLDWVLIVSDELNVDREGEKLAEPHRLVARLDGSLDLLPASEVATALASQPLE